MAACWLATWACFFGASANGGENLAGRLPGESCFALLTDNFLEFGKSFRKTNLGRLATGDEFGPLVAELEKRDRATLLHLRPWFGFDWAQIEEVAGPGAVVIFPHTKGQFGAACLLDASDSPQARTECLASGERYFLAKKFRKSSVRGAGYELTVYEPASAKSGDFARVHFVSGSLFGAATSRAAAEALLATKEAASLARQANFQQLVISESSDAVAGSTQLFVRPVELWSLSLGDRSKRKVSSRDSFVMARRQGIEALEAAGGVVRFPTEKTCDLEFSVRVKVHRPLKRAIGLVDFKAGAAPSLPQWCAAATSSVLSWRWDFPSAMNAFGSLFDEYNEPGPDGEGLFDDLLSGLRDDPEGPRVDLKRDLFSRLGPQVMSVADREGTISAQNPAGARSLNVVSCREVPLVASFLKKLYAGEKNVAYEKQGEVHLWTAKKNGNLFVEGEDQSLMDIRAVALTPSELIFSSDIAYVRAALAAKVPADPLDKDADWRLLNNKLQDNDGERSALRGFIRLDQFLEPGYGYLRAGKPQAKEGADAALLRLLLFGTLESKPAPPFGALPEFKLLRDRLRPFGVRLTLTDDGWLVRGAMLATEQSP